MKAPDFITIKKNTPIRGKNFFDIAEENPCNGCSAPCCHILLIPHPTPTTFMDLDYIRYMLEFPSVEMILNSDGQWQVFIEQTCRLLDQKTNLCAVHNTSRKPKTCAFFNPHRCWYKQSFHKTENPQDLIRIDIEALEAILLQVQFDENGNIIEIPKWESIKELVEKNKSQLISKQKQVESQISEG
jgi:Fe-S-cluster containining protein